MCAALTPPHPVASAYGRGALRQGMSQKMFAVCRISAHGSLIERNHRHRKAKLPSTACLIMKAMRAVKVMGFADARLAG